MTLTSALPAWLTQCEKIVDDGTWPTGCLAFRKEAWQAFIKNGLPTRTDERFKYTDFSFLEKQPFSIAQAAKTDTVGETIHRYRIKTGKSHLLVFINGHFVPTLSDQHFPPGCVASSIKSVIQNGQFQHEIKQSFQSCNVSRYPFAGLNAALFSDGLFLYIPDECELPHPLHLLSLTVNEEAMSQPRHMIVLGAKSRVTLVEEHQALSSKAYLTNQVSHILVGSEASLTHYKIQQDNRHAIHLAHTFIQQSQDSHVQLAQFSIGSLFARDDVIVTLQEAGSNCRALGFYHLDAQHQTIAHYVNIEHIAPRTHSEMLYKGVLDNKSRAIFNGRLYVDKKAQKTLAYQANHNVLLSQTAEVYSKPELEIYAEDIACKHGATTGQLDEEALFYLRARGVPHEKAMNILLRGFANEVLQRILHKDIHAHVKNRMTYESESFENE